LFFIVGSLTSISPPTWFVAVEVGLLLSADWAWPPPYLPSSSRLLPEADTLANSDAMVEGNRAALWSSRASLNSSLISSYWGISYFSQGRACPPFKPCSSNALIAISTPCFYCLSSHLVLLASTQSDKNSWVFTSALTKIVFSYNFKLFIVLRQAKTDSIQSNSASPND